MSQDAKELNKIILSCNDLTLGYEGNTQIEKVTFKIYEGDYFLIVGRNGSGKSTLLKGLLGLLKPKEGQCRFEGIRPNEVGYLPQVSQIAKDFPASVREVVMSGVLNRQGFVPFYRKRDKERAEKYMKRMDIFTMKNKRFAELSGGERQRVLLCRALLATSGLLVLDEPVAGLDPYITNEMYQELSDLNKKEHLAILMVTHDLKGSLPYANKVLHIEEKTEFFDDVEKYKESEAYKKITGGIEND